MLLRVLLLLVGVTSLLGLVLIFVSLFAVHFIENGVDRHVVSWPGIWRGVEFLLVGAVLGIIALIVKNSASLR